MSSGSTHSTRRPSVYERGAIDEIRAWHNPPRTWFTGVKEQAGSAWGGVTDLVHRIPGVEWTLDNIVSGLLELTNEITQDSVWTEAVIKDYHDNGHEITTLADVKDLDLSQVDSVLAGLDKKYVGLATIEGAATGVAGAAGMIPDLIALVSINLRAAGEYASYCGFDIRADDERLYALQLLDRVAGDSGKAREVTIAPVVRTASRVARQQTANVLEQVGVGNAIEAIARRLGIHLTEKKLAQMVPVTGALFGGGLNYLYTRSVCKTAHFLYRERFLESKYGPGITT